MTDSLKIPRLRRWKARGLGYCNFKGRRYYFGKWGEPETERRFLAFIQKITAPASVSPTVRSDDPTLAEVVLSFFEARRHYYQKDGRSTRQLERFRAACEYPLAMFAELPVRLLGPRRLLEARDAMEASGRFSRSYINTLISCFRGVIRYGVEAELVRPDVLVALQAVAPLKRGRSSAREVEPIKPVTAETVESTLAELGGVVGDMVRIQRLTGMRPGEVCQMRAGDLVDDDHGGLVYVLRSDKTDWRRAAGNKRRIPIGPRAQAILCSYLIDRGPDDYLFTPAEAVAQHRIERRRGRQTSDTSSSSARRRLAKSKAFAPCYNKDTYRRAIQRAAIRAGVAPWSPNQLRHLFATEIRERYGLEAAQACLGHARADVTQIYAERDYRKAEEVARREG